MADSVKQASQSGLGHPGAGVAPHDRFVLPRPRQFSTYEARRLKLIASYCQGKSVLDLGYAQLPNPYLLGLYRVGVDLKSPCENVGDLVGSTRYDEEVIGDVLQLDRTMAGRVFDNIVAGELIEHIEKPYEFLRSLKSLLAPGGRLILSTPNPLAFPVQLFELIRSRRFFYTLDHVYYFCPRWVERMLEFSGYQMATIKGVGLWNPVFPVPCPASLSYQVVYVATLART